MKQLAIIIGVLLVFGHPSWAADVPGDNPQQFENRSPFQEKLPPLQGSFQHEKMAMKKDINEHVAQAKREIKELKQQIRASDKKFSANARQALARLESDLQELEGEMKKVNEATEKDWEAIKSKAKTSVEKVKESLTTAKTKEH